MKKNALVCLIAVLGLFHVNLNAQAYSFSINPNYTICSGGNSNVNIPYYLNCIITNTAPGAGYHTFTLSPGCSIFSITQSNNSYTIGLWCNAPGIHTVTGLAYVSINNPSIVATMNQTISVLPGPTVTINGPNNLCPNTSYSFFASGANNYTWTSFNGQNSASLTGAAVTLTTGTLLNYSLSAIANNTCKFYSNFAPQVGSSTVSISPQNTLCPGSSCTLSAQGAISYTWSNGSTSSSIVVSPTATTIYTLSSNNGTCLSNSTHTVFLSNLINLSVSSVSPVCSGNSAVLTASGANTYTWIPGNLSGATVTLNPLTATCYTVIGSNAACSASATSCVSVIPSPTVSITSNPTLICLGSSVTYSAMGATNYTWSTGSTGSSVQIIPLNANATVSVIAGHTLNSCVRLQSVSVVVSTACAVVWPGDANRDGTVSNLDVLELGLQANFNGPARTNTSNAWIAQTASVWNGTLSNGWNRVHADCNGDGTVNNTDMTAINQNFNLNHAFKSSVNSAQDIGLQFINQPLLAGKWNKAELVLNTNAAYYGIAFGLNYQNTLIQADSVKIIYPASFLNAANQNFDFYKSFNNTGSLYGATVRTNHANATGNGTVAEIWFKTQAGSGGQTLTLSLHSTQKVQANGLYSNLNADAPISAYISFDTGVNENQLPAVSIYPNPANQLIYIHPSYLGNPFTIEDLSGRIVKESQVLPEGNTVHDLSNGFYIIRIKNKSYRILINHNQ